VSRPLPCGIGDTRRAALRPFVPTPVLVPLGYPSLPNRDAESNAPPPKLSPRSIVRIYVHGSKDRAKDASPSACDDLSCLRWVHTLRARMLTSFPSSAAFGHPLSSARLLAAGIPLLARRTDLGLRSDDPPRRVPPFRRPGCLSPPRHAKECLVAERLLSPAFAPALSLTPPTLYPRLGTVLLIGHCKVTVWSPTRP
jgi:hypothetical protein